MTVEINYPCSEIGEPGRLTRLTIDRLASESRKRIFGYAARSLDIDELIRRTRRMAVNGRDFEISWDRDHAVHDRSGAPVLGVCEHDPAAPNVVMISLNVDLLADNAELARSTAAHELGHALFDMPAALARAERRSFRTLASGTSVRHRSNGGKLFTPPKDAARSAEAIDWREWRADEFMGSFLAPRDLLMRALRREAGRHGIKLRGWDDAGAKPMLTAFEHGWDVIEAITDALAEEFGVSPAFMTVRLRKHRLVAAR
jgi:hypothetical protein